MYDINTKLKWIFNFSIQQNVDETTLQLGPGGGAGRFSGWQRGSTGGGARTSQEAEKPAGTPSNR